MLNVLSLIYVFLCQTSSQIKSLWEKNKKIVINPSSGYNYWEYYCKSVLSQSNRYITKNDYCDVVEVMIRWLIPLPWKGEHYHLIQVLNLYFIDNWYWTSICAPAYYNFLHVVNCLLLSSKARVYLYSLSRQQLLGPVSSSEHPESCWIWIHLSLI